ncbi:MAG: DUF1573 domain-containing protein, partial [Planctomycetia bacterium]
MQTLFLIAALSLAAADDAVLRFDKSVVDLGVVRSVGVVEQEFPFVVTADAVQIVDLQPGCGCLRSSLDKRSYTAGETGRVKLAIHAVSQSPGRHRYLLTVVHRSPELGRQVLAVDLDLQSDVAVEPSTLLVLTSGKTDVERTITLTDRRGDFLKVTRAESSSPRVVVGAPTRSASPGSWVT